MQSDQEHEYQDWLGKQQRFSDILTVTPMAGLAATLDRAITTFEAGDALPPLWHWLYFLQPTRHSDIAEDGHPQRGSFLPPIPLPRRMWAGSRLHFERPLLAGEEVTRTSTIKSIDIKQGRSGKLGFVCVAHELVSGEQLALREEHDIVYRAMPSPDNPAAPAKKADGPIDFARTITPNPAMLFRYSALTFNAHRIHYDRDYAQGTELYPGLVVHGPLLATLLLEMFRDNYPTETISYFEFKALRPVFDIHSFQCCGSKLDSNGICTLWIQDNEGNLCLEARAKVKDAR